MTKLAAKTETVTLMRAEYDALIARKEDLEDTLAAIEADDGSRIPHEAALAIMRGENPCAAFRNYRGLTLRDLSARTGLSASYLSEIEHGRKTGSVAALSRIAGALGATVDILIDHELADGKPA